MNKLMKSMYSDNAPETAIPCSISASPANCMYIAFKRFMSYAVNNAKTITPTTDKNMYTMLLKKNKLMMPPIIKAINEPNKIDDIDAIDFLVVTPYKAIPANKNAVVKNAVANVPIGVTIPMTVNINPFNTANPINIPNACAGFW